MKNITISLDPETAKWLRVQAAEKDTSVSRLVGELLREKMKHRIEYERAMREYLAKKPFPINEPGEPLPTRDEIHDRTRFR